MTDIRTLALPAVNLDYDANNEAVTRRTIEQAIQLFKTTQMDALCVGDTLYQK